MTPRPPSTTPFPYTTLFRSIGASLDGYFADMARTLPVGEISDEARRLLQVTEEALYKGIEKAVPGGRLSDISHRSEEHTSELQSRENLVCRLLLEKKKNTTR